MATTASIIIEVNEAGAVAKLAAVNAEAAKLGPTLQPVQHISEQTFNNIETGALRARESAALLGEEFGVKIPRALRGTIAEAAGIGPIFSAAFSGLAIVGFINIAMEAGKKIAELVEHLWGHAEQAKKSMEAQAELNKIIAEGTDKVEKLQEAYRLIGLQGLPRISEQQAIANEKFEAGKKLVGDLTARLQILKDEYAKNKEQVAFSWGIQALPTGPSAAVEALKGAPEKIAALTKELTAAKENLADLGEETKKAGKEFDTTFAKDRAEEIKKIAKATEEASKRLDEMTAAANKAGLTGEAQITADAMAQMLKAEEIFSREPTLVAEKNAAIFTSEAEAGRKRIKLLTEEADKRFKIEDEEQTREENDAQHHAEKQRRMEDETINIERAAAISMAPPWERANAAITANYEERMAKIRELVKTGDLDEQYAARMQTAALQELYAQRRDELATQMEGLFNDITSGNIGKRFLDLFKKMVFEMLATWIMGMRGMRAASQQTMNSGGGILGAIFGSLGLGGIFGGGGGGGAGGAQDGVSSLPGVITNFAGGESSSLSPMGISAGGGFTAGGVLPAGAGSGGGANGPLGELLGKLFSHDAGPVSGSMLGMAGISLLAASWRKGGVLGALGGAAGGALTGFAIGGPIGALIGGIAGLIAGIWGHSTKQARLQIEANIKTQAKAIEDGYNLFQTDWTGSRTALEALRQQGVDALKQAGVKDINRSRVGHVDQWIDKAEKEIDLTQAERNRRSALVFGPPQFRVGGFVGPGLGGPMPDWFAGTAMHFADGGAVPAILHQGEFVMRPEAVSRIGVGNLASMNAGGSGGDTYVTNVSLSAWDGKSVEEWLSNGGMDKIAYAHRRGVMEGRY